MSGAGAFDGRGARICAIFTPKSPSAEYSAGLEQNCARIDHYARYDPLPSPSTSDSGAESGMRPPCKRTLAKTSTKKARSWKRKGAGHAVIVLRQSRNDESFVFGSSQRTGNEVVFKHQHPEEPACCWVNLIHLQLFPHPDNDVLVLYNQSTSAFSTQSSSKSTADSVESGQSATLARGIWRLTLGEGFAFEVEVLLGGVGRPYHGGLRLSHTESALFAKRSKTNTADTSRHNAMAVKRNARCKSTVEAQAKPEPTREPHGASSTGTLERCATSSPEGSIIGRTSHTEVRKVYRKGSMIAIKLCRSPDLKQSADRWRNELDILSLLDHVRQSTGAA